MVNPFDIAAAQIGLNEHDKVAALTDYLETGGQNLDPATTAWCTAFVNGTVELAGMESTGQLNARSYLDWGQEVSEPQRGDIAVFSRGDPNGWEGHVGFFDGYNEDGSIRVLGGNQGDAVNISNFSASNLLGFRRADGQQAQQATQPSQNALAAVAREPERPQMQFARLDPAQFQSKRNALNLIDLSQFGGRYGA